MNFLESLTSFFANILDIISIPDVEKNTINQKIVGASVIETITELVRNSPTNWLDFKNKSSMDEKSMGKVYQLLIERFGEAEVKKLLAEKFHINLLSYLESISDKISPEQKSEIEALIEESQLFDLLSIPKILLDFITE